MELIFWLAVFVGTLFLLIKSCDYFIDSAESISRAFGVPSFIIGITIVALGTSLPELVSSIVAVMENSSEIVVGNVVGSNIANILLVTGFVAYMGSPFSLKSKVNKLDNIVLLGSALFLILTIWDGQFTFWEGIIGVVCLLVYLFLTFAGSEGDEMNELPEERRKLPWYVFPILILSLVFIWLSAQYNIISIIKLSEILNIGKEIIALTAVALGTSLPELFVSISCLKKNNPDMAMGNVMGSNIFNILCVMGFPSLISALTIPSVVIYFSLPVMILATLFYYYLIRKNAFTRNQGIALLLLYVFVTLYSFFGT